MKYAIEKIEGEKVELEELATGKIKTVPLSKLPSNIEESDILFYENSEYHIDYEEKESRLKIINDKFCKLKENSN